PAGSTPSRSRRRPTTARRTLSSACCAPTRGCASPRPAPRSMPGTTDSARRRRAWWCGLLLAVAAVAGAADRPIAIAPERLVLATFRFTQPGYWRRLVDQIGERYRVEASYAWTMRSLGETCVVFRLEPGTDPAPVVAALRAD